MVPEVPPPRAGDEYGREEGHDGDAEEVDGRRGGLAPHRRDGLVVARNALVPQRRVQRGRRSGRVARGKFICVRPGRDPGVG